MLPWLELKCIPPVSHAQVTFACDTSCHRLCSPTAASMACCWPGSTPIVIHSKTSLAREYRNLHRARIDRIASRTILHTLLATPKNHEREFSASACQ